MKKIVILTGSELRHEFFRKFMGSDARIHVLKSYCEVPEKTLSEAISAEQDYQSRSVHLVMRDQTEQDFFALFCSKIMDNSNPEILPKGAVNTTEKIAEISALQPDLIIAYGCSLIKPPLIAQFEGRFINVHLGLSPYYRGSGTNFFPFANGAPEFAGVTFMHIDAGIDTGAIIHQIRPEIIPGDNIHQIGNRLIAQMANITAELVYHFDELDPLDAPLFDKINEKVYRKADFTETAMTQMYGHFSNGMISDYLANKTQRDALVPLLQNPVLASC